MFIVCRIFTVLLVVIGVFLGIFEFLEEYTKLARVELVPCVRLTILMNLSYCSLISVLVLSYFSLVSLVCPSGVSLIALVFLLEGCVELLGTLTKYSLS